MTRCNAGTGVALVAALLTVAAISTLALATALVVRLDMMLAGNRQALALARAESRSRLVLLLLELEAVSQDGEFPEHPPMLPGVVAYRLTGPAEAVVGVVGGRAGVGGYRSDARVELHWHEDIWRVHIVEQR